MVTFEQATAGEFVGNAEQRAARTFFSYMYDMFHTPGYSNADGTPHRWRRNGATKTWKTRPGHFRIPVKRGLREYFYITHENAHQFSVGEGID